MNGLSHLYLMFNENQPPQLAMFHAREEFLKLKGEMKMPEVLNDKEKIYYDYTCKTEDFIRMCNIPSPQMTDEDLVIEKKILSM